MIKSIVVFLTIALFSINQFTMAENKSSMGINWVTMEKAQELVNEEPRKIFVDVYTDWCSWCKRMDANTFSHPDIIDYINSNFYAVKLNAEQEEPIVFRGQKYINENPGERRSTHNFAVALLQGRMSYPSVAFFDENLNLITALPGYREPSQFEPILVFFHEDHFLNEPDLDAFIQNFEGTID